MNMTILLLERLEWLIETTRDVWERDCSWTIKTCSERDTWKCLISRDPWMFARK